MRHIIITEEHMNIIPCIILTKEHMNIIPEHYKLWMEEVIKHIILLKGDIQFFSQLLNILNFLRIFPKVRIRYIYLCKLLLISFYWYVINIFVLINVWNILYLVILLCFYSLGTYSVYWTASYS